MTQTAATHSDYIPSIHPRESDRINLGNMDIAELWALRALVGGSPRGPVMTAIGVAGGVGSLSSTEGDGGAKAREKLLRLHAQAEAAAAAAKAPAVLMRNLDRLGDLVGLQPLERDLLGFAVLLRTDPLLEQVGESMQSVTTSRLVDILSAALKADPGRIRTALALTGALCRSGLLTVDRSAKLNLIAKLDLPTGEFADRMISADCEPIEVFLGRLMPAPAPELDRTSYAHVRELDFLIDYLRNVCKSGRRAVNCLIWGAPGLGKTQLTRLLADQCGAALYEVSSRLPSGETIEPNMRIRAYQCAQRILKGDRSMIVFDEFDDVINMGFQSNPFDSAMTKSALNDMLETNGVPSLYVANSIEGLNESVLRRFDFVLEIRQPSIDQRRRILRECFPHGICETTIAALVTHERVTPALLAKATAVVSQSGASVSPQELENRLLMLVEQKVRAATGRQGELSKGWGSIVAGYDPMLTNAGVDLARLAEGLTRAGEGRLLLWGPPGTGKTEFGRWLAGYLDRPLKLARASTLLGGIIGETEARVAAVFADAIREGAVLLIDEADSFLLDRRGAQRSWEVTMVNETLTQMESFRNGFLIMTTNLMENFDQAAMRRFDEKVKFDFLRGEQAVTLLERHCRALQILAPDASTLAHIAKIRGLTPGDFATVTRQARLRGLVNAGDLVKALEIEVGLKRDGGIRPLGFLQ